jgi:hypothetical protein
VKVKVRLRIQFVRYDGSSIQDPKESWVKDLCNNGYTRALNEPASKSVYVF